MLPKGAINLIGRTLAMAACALIHVGCNPQKESSAYFGKVDPPPGQVLRYITGSEPESLDPQVGSGQPEARLYLALFDGLVEYHPVTGLPIPALAEKWEINNDSSQFTFHLRKNARWTHGRPITAHDFIYSFRRGLDPAFASRNAYLAYDIKYAQGYNEGGVFVKDKRAGAFLLEKDYSLNPGPEGESSANAPRRLVLAGAESDREKQIASFPKLQLLRNNLEFVPVQATDLAVEALDDYTLRIQFNQPAPYFLGLLAHQFFRPSPRDVIEKYGLAWTRPENIATSGAFKLVRWAPYNEIVVKRNEGYWDAARTRLSEIHFFPTDEITTMQNLYKAGEVDATYNHTVPAAWLDIIRQKKDYMDSPEAAIEYYMFNVTRAPMNDLRVRRAFNLAVDKVALAKFRKTYKPLTAFTPEGIFPGYPRPEGEQFDPEKAKQLLVEAGFKDASGKFDPSNFPVRDVELIYNTTESNRQVAEFVQAQWKQNLGVTVPLRNMEFKTFLQARARLEYKGVARSGWVGDYMDPFTFLALFSTEGGDNGTGWFDPKYVDMLKDANRELVPAERYKRLAEAETYLLKAQPVIPLGTPSTSWMKKPYVKGMFSNPQSLYAWKFVYIEHNPALWENESPEDFSKQITP